MIRRLWLLFGLALAFIVGQVSVHPAHADGGPWFTDGCITGCANNFTSGTGPFVIKVGSGTFHGVSNLSISAQTNSFTIFDNSSACSGKQLDGEAPLGATQKVWVDAIFYNGLTVCETAAAASPGVLVLYR